MKSRSPLTIDDLVLGLERLAVRSSEDADELVAGFERLGVRTDENEPIISYVSPPTHPGGMLEILVFRGRKLYGALSHMCKMSEDVAEPLASIPLSGHGDVIIIESNFYHEAERIKFHAEGLSDKFAVETSFVTGRLMREGRRLVPNFPRHGSVSEETLAAALGTLSQNGYFDGDDVPPLESQPTPCAVERPLKTENVSEIPTICRELNNLEQLHDDGFIMDEEYIERRLLLESET